MFPRIATLAMVWAGWASAGVTSEGSEATRDSIMAALQSHLEHPSSMSLNYTYKDAFRPPAATETKYTTIRASYLVKNGRFRLETQASSPSDGAESNSEVLKTSTEVLSYDGSRFYYLNGWGRLSIGRNFRDVARGTHLDRHPMLYALGFMFDVEDQPLPPPGFPGFPTTIDASRILAIRLNENGRLQIHWNRRYKNNQFGEVVVELDPARAFYPVVRSLHDLHTRRTIVTAIERMGTFESDGRLYHFPVFTRQKVYDVDGNDLMLDRTLEVDVDSVTVATDVEDELFQISVVDSELAVDDDLRIILKRP